MDVLFTLGAFCFCSIYVISYTPIYFVFIYTHIPSYCTRCMDIILLCIWIYIYIYFYYICNTSACLELNSIWFSTSVCSSLWYLEFIFLLVCWIMSQRLLSRSGLRWFMKTTAPVFVVGRSSIAHQASACDRGMSSSTLGCISHCQGPPGTTTEAHLSKSSKCKYKNMRRDTTHEHLS